MDPVLKSLLNWPAEVWPDKSLKKVEPEPEPAMEPVAEVSLSAPYAPLSLEACRSVMLGALAFIAQEEPSPKRKAELGWIRAKCSRCGCCELAPR